MRKCKTCRQEKPDKEFYNYGLGFMDNCIDCTKLIKQENSATWERQNRIYHGLEKP